MRPGIFICCTDTELLILDFLILLLSLSRMRFCSWQILNVSFFFFFFLNWTGKIFEFVKKERQNFVDIYISY